MKIMFHNGLGDYQTLEVTRVVVLDKYDNPLAVAAELGDDLVIAETAQEATQRQFNEVLRNLGIDKVVSVIDVQAPGQPQINSG